MALVRLGHLGSGRMSGLQFGSTDRASLLVKTHSVVGGISLFKRFLLDLGSQPRWCAVETGSRRQENVPPVLKRCLIVLVTIQGIPSSNYDAGGKPGAAQRVMPLICIERALPGGVVFEPT
jgi:hypothetical protein